MSKGVVLIPAYKPDEHLIELVQSLNGHGFKILVVDDGSGHDYLNIFDQVKKFAKVLVHTVNRGKGYALKTGISHLRSFYGDCDYFITADADGQHRVEDILKIDQKLSEGASIVLTNRKLSGKIPFRSKFGNLLSSFIYTLLTGNYFSDNQSGLRGFNMVHCDWLLSVKGSHYDYEMNVIYHADRQRIKFTIIDIPAIYIDGNKSSHFNPVLDTIRIYKQLFLSALGSLLSVILMLALTIALAFTIGNRFIGYSIPVVGILGVTFNMIMTRKVTLKYLKTKDYGRILVRAAIRVACYACALELTCLLLPNLLLFLAFALIMILFIAPEYYLIKWFTLYSRKKRKNLAPISK